MYNQPSTWDLNERQKTWEIGWELVKSWVEATQGCALYMACRREVCHYALSLFSTPRLTHSACHSQLPQEPRQHWLWLPAMGMLRPLNFKCACAFYIWLQTPHPWLSVHPISQGKILSPGRQDVSNPSPVRRPSRWSTTEHPVLDFQPPDMCTSHGWSLKVSALTGQLPILKWSSMLPANTAS